MSAETLVRSDSDQLTKAMAESARDIEEALSDLLERPSGGEARLVDAMRYATLNGGKRLRGFLVLETARLFSVSPASAVRVAASVEMLHAYSLVHDDLPAMDDDDLRRGQPSTHRRFDEATAILAGDALQCRAFELLAEPATHPDAQARCELVMALGAASGVRGMAGGQMIDMQAEGRPVSAEEVAMMQALKTGCLIRYSAEAGAILGRVGGEAHAQIIAFGRDLGAAFQIADDLLDETADSVAIGKTAGKDAAAGKATLVALLGIDQATQAARELSERAASHLTSFGAAADLLRALCLYVVSRGN